MSTETNYSLLASGVTGDMAADWTSTPICMSLIHNIAIQLVFTGSPVGTFTLQSSEDAGGSLDVGMASITGLSNWSTVANTSTAIAAAGDATFNGSAIASRWLRVKYTRTSGTGTITSARVTLKGY